MEGLNLANLNINIRVNGAEQATSEVDNLTRHIQDSGSSTQESTGRIQNGFNSLSSGIRAALGNVNIFGVSLGDMASALQGGAGATAVLQGVVTGLSSALVDLAMRGLQMAIEGMKKFVSEGIELASDLEEIQNVLDTTFGDNSNDVNNWCIELASNFGLTELQAKKFSSTIGAVFNGMGMSQEQIKEMSINMTQLTGDMASFYNLGHEEAFEKIKAGITGETEPLKSLGIVMTEANLSAFAMSQGIETAYRAMSESEKTLLRYNYIIEQTNLAHGDFAKTQDSYSNASKTLENTISSLSAELGEGFLPILGEIKADLSEVLEGLRPVFSFIGTLVGGLLQRLYDSIKPIIEIIKVVVNVLNPVFEILNKIAEAVNSIMHEISTSILYVAEMFGKQIGVIQETTGEAVEYTTEKIESETNEALGYVENAVESWVDEQMKEYEEKIRSRYGSSGSLANEIQIQKQIEKHEARLREQGERTATAIEKAEKKKQEALKKTNELYEKQAKYSSGNTSSSYNGRKFATGTNFFTGGYAMVGEQGREIVELPRGSKIYNNRQTENMLNNNSTTNNNSYNITINANNIKEFNDIVNMCNGYVRTKRMGV